MTKNHSRPNPKQNVEVMLAGIFRYRAGKAPEEACPDNETLALLAEGKLSGREKDRVQDHLSRCPSCLDAFLILVGLEEDQTGPERIRPKPVLLRPLALAASLVLVVLSIFILYKTGNLPGISRVRSGTDSEAGKPFILQEKAAPAPGAPEKSRARTEETDKKSPDVTADEKKGAEAPDAGAGIDRDTGRKNLPGTQGPLEIPRPGKKEDGKIRAEESKAKLGKKGPGSAPEIRQEEPKSESKETEEPAMLRQTVTGKTADRLQVADQADHGHREVVSRYPDGQPKTVNVYRPEPDRKILVEIIEYDNLGRIIAQNDPEKNTLVKTGYHPNGQKKFVERYLNNRPDGTWIKWDSRGRIIEKTEYRQGKIVDQTPDE